MASWTLAQLSARTEKGKHLPSLETLEKVGSAFGLPVAALVATRSTVGMYGLVNVRTDGTRVLCGSMKENSKDFDIQFFYAGVEV